MNQMNLTCYCSAALCKERKEPATTIFINLLIGNIENLKMNEFEVVCSAIKGDERMNDDYYLINRCEDTN